jgi:large subunit ribosomal protein L18
MKLIKEKRRARRHNRIRSKVCGTAKCPRLNVYRSLNQIYAQLIDDDKGLVIAAASSLKLKKAKPMEIARQVGLDIAKNGKEKNVESCVFDRGGYLYHGRVKALADGAREGGLKF